MSILLGTNRTLGNGRIQLIPSVGFDAVRSLRLTNLTADVLIVTNVNSVDQSREYLLPSQQMVYPSPNTSSPITVTGLTLTAAQITALLYSEWGTDDEASNDFPGTYPVAVSSGSTSSADSGQGPLLVQVGYAAAVATDINTLTVAMPYPVTPGNFLIAALSNYPPGVVTPPSSGWVQKAIKSTTDVGIVFYQYLVQAGDGQSYIWDWNNTDFYTVRIFEYSGTAGIDQIGVSTGNNGQTATLTPSVAGTAAITAFVMNNGSSSGTIVEPTLNSGWIPDLWSVPHFQSFGTALQAKIGAGTLTATWSTATADQAVIVVNLLPATITANVNAFNGRTGIVAPRLGDYAGIAGLIPVAVAGQYNARVGQLIISTQNGTPYNIYAPTLGKDGLALKGGEVFGAICLNGSGNVGAIIDFSDVGQKVQGPGITPAGIECLLCSPFAFAIFEYDIVTAIWYIIAGEQDPGWNPLPTLQNSWASTSGVAWRSKGDVTIFRGVFTTNGASGTLVSTLFSGQFPPENVSYVLPCLVGGVPSVAYMLISAANGQIQITYPAGATGISLFPVFYTND